MARFRVQQAKVVIKITLIAVISSLITFILAKFMTGGNKYNKKPFKFDTSNSNEKEVIKNAAIDAFNVYSKNCADFDEVNPKTHECYNNYGFYATAVESLETMYLLGLKEQFKTAKKIVLNNLVPEKIGWVNRQEFWSRCVGSLIGTYLLTGDGAFVSRAIVFADKLLQMQSKTSRFPTYVNFQEKKTSATKWKNQSVAFSDITVGIQELAALYNITKSSKYLTAINQAIIAIPEMKGPKHPFVNVHKHSVDENDNSVLAVDDNVLDMYNALAKAYLITGSKPIIKKLSSLEMNLVGEASLFSSDDSIETERILRDVELSLNTGEWNKRVDASYGSIKQLFTARQVRRSLQGFNFGSLPIRAMLISGKEGIFESMFIDGLDEFKYHDGYSGKMFTSNKRWIPSGVQDSSFTGEFLKLAAEYIVFNGFEIEDLIVNSHGHFLKMRS